MTNTKGMIELQEAPPEPVLAPNGRYVADDEYADLCRFDMDDDEWYGRNEW